MQAWNLVLKLNLPLWRYESEHCSPWTINGLGVPWKLLYVQVHGNLFRLPHIAAWMDPFLCPPASVLPGCVFQGFPFSRNLKTITYKSLSLVLCRFFTGKKLFVYLVFGWVWGQKNLIQHTPACMRAHSHTVLEAELELKWFDCAALPCA